MSRLARPAAMAVLAAAIATVLAFLVTPAPAADDPLDRYVARLSVDDHYNSNGKRLDNTAAIIRQDRANFHKFGVRDPEDQSDGFFSSIANRALLERMLRKGGTPQWVHNAVVNGTPLIEVTIFNDFVEVSIIDENTGAGTGGGTGAGTGGGGDPFSDLKPGEFPSNRAGSGTTDGGMQK